MKKILYIIILIAFAIPLKSQHFDPIYTDDVIRTWEDSGWYFVPEITNWKVAILGPGGSDVIQAIVNFRSSDESGLMYTGRAVFFVDPETLPNDVNIQEGTRGKATILLPEDILLCPSPSDEQGMGQNDPYFPLYLAGRLDRIGNNIPDDPIHITVQLNVFNVN